MLFGLGDFRFHVPSFSFEDTDSKVESRVSEVEVIGVKPITHLLGPSARTLSLSTTYFPLHMNKAGDLLIAAVEAATEAQTPLVFMQMQGLIGVPFGRWIITGIGNTRSFFTIGGRAQLVKASLELQEYVTQTSGGQLGLY